jgi:signal transduction histidine kinase
MRSLQMDSHSITDTDLEPLAAQLIEELSLGLILIDESGTVIWANDHQRDFTGLSSEHWIGESVYQEEGPLVSSGLSDVVLLVHKMGICWPDRQKELTFPGPETRSGRIKVIPLGIGRRPSGTAVIFFDDSRSLSSRKTPAKETLGPSFCVNRQFQVVDADADVQRYILGPSCQIIHNQPCYKLFFSRRTPCPDCPAKTVLEEDRMERVRRPSSYPHCASAARQPSGTDDIIVHVEFDRVGEQESVFQEERENRLVEHVVDTMPGLVAVIDSSFRLLLVNAAFRVWQGKQSRELLGQPLTHYPPFSDNPEFQNAVQNCFKDKSTHRLTQNRRIADWVQEGPLHMMVRFIEDRQDKRVLVFAHHREKIREQAVEPAVQSCFDLGEFAGRLAHDLSNPLSILLSKIDLLRNRQEQPIQDPHDLQKEIDSLQTYAKRIQEALDKIGALNNHTPNDVRKMDLGLVINRAILMAELHRPHKYAKIITEIPETLPPVWGCDSRLERALYELLMNALQASGQSGQVLLSVKEDIDGLIGITIQDQGIGIAASDLPRVFEPFFSTKARKGRGLGLTIAATVIYSHQGKIDIKSQENNGTTVEIRLPQHGSGTEWIE